MHQIIFGIFAHPDDETLCAGTFMKLVSEGAVLHLVVVTDGQAGANPLGASDLGATRLEEWLHSAQNLGAASTQALHYEDGQLHSDQVNSIEDDLKQLVLSRLATLTEDTSVIFVTFDNDGLTGHRDHQIVTDAVSQAFSALKVTLPAHISLDRLLYYRLSSAQAAAGPSTPEYPLTGYAEDSCDQTVQVDQFIERKKSAMSCHTSQNGDMDKWKQLPRELFGVEYFRVGS